MASPREDAYFREKERVARLKERLVELIPVMHAAESHAAWCTDDPICHVYNNQVLMQLRIEDEGANLDTISKTVASDFCTIYMLVIASFKTEFENAKAFHTKKKIPALLKKKPWKYGRGPRPEAVVRLRKTFDEFVSRNQKALNGGAIPLNKLAPTQVQLIEALVSVYSAIEILDAQIQTYTAKRRADRNEKLAYAAPLLQTAGTLATGVPLPIPAPSA